MITIYGCSTKRQFVPTTLVTLACRDGYERAAHLYPALQPASAHVLPPEVSVVEVPLLVG